MILNPYFEAGGAIGEAMPMPRDANERTRRMGETKDVQIAVLGRAVESMVVDAPGARLYLCWADGAPQASYARCQNGFFAEFPRAAGMFDECVRTCSARIPQRQRAGQMGCAGNFAAGDSGGSPAVCTQRRCAVIEWWHRRRAYSGSEAPHGIHLFPEVIGESPRSRHAT